VAATTLTTVWLAPTEIRTCSPAAPVQGVALETQFQVAVHQHHELVRGVHEIRPNLSRRVDSDGRAEAAHQFAAIAAWSSSALVCDIAPVPFSDAGS
jgi:hypothetical protein